MHRENNIFGDSGTTGNDKIQNYFSLMKAEVLTAYEYHAYDLEQMGCAIDRIVELENKLSQVCSEINMERERTHDLLVEKGIIE